MLRYLALFIRYTGITIFWTSIVAILGSFAYSFIKEYPGVAILIFVMWICFMLFFWASDYLEDNRK